MVTTVEEHVIKLLFYYLVRWWLDDVNYLQLILISDFWFVRAITLVKNKQISRAFFLGGGGGNPINVSGS